MSEENEPAFGSIDDALHKLTELDGAVAMLTEVAARNFTTLRKALGSRRTSTIVKARHACAFALRERYRLSFPEIAAYLRYECHTSVMHAVRAHEKRRRAKPESELEMSYGVTT